jgi:uncharacterized protein (DUF1697 family)
MTLHIAFLRAINVGGHTVKMDALRGLFAELGFTSVSTYIASGNILFSADETDAAALEERIEAYLAAQLGYEVATFVRAQNEVIAVAERHPFPAAELAAAFGLMVAFLKKPPTTEERARLLTYRRPSDDFAVNGRELYWLRRTQQSETNFTGATLERLLNAPATIRNINTVRKLADLSRAKS